MRLQTIKKPPECRVHVGDLETSLPKSERSYRPRSFAPVLGSTQGPLPHGVDEEPGDVLWHTPVVRVLHVQVTVVDIWHVNHDQHQGQCQGYVHHHGHHWHS